MSDEDKELNEAYEAGFQAGYEAGVKDGRLEAEEAAFFEYSWGPWQ